MQTLIAKTAAIAAVTAIAAALGAAVPAAASDHLADAAGAPGAGQRGFGNPVAENPSGTSGPHADPATVPGEGNPAAGTDTTTPAVDRDLVGERSGQGG